MTIGHGLASPNQPDKGPITTCQASLEADWCWGARSVTVVGNRGEPSGESRLIYRQALRIAEKAFDPGHPSVTTILLNYSLLLTDLGRSVEARELKKRADEWHTVEVSDDGLEVPISYH